MTDDPVNAGVERDGILTEGPQAPVRLVVYRDPLSGELIKFITILMAATPGVIAQLYRMRRNIEKSFDSFKNKLFEAKAWATGPEAQAAQANFMVLALNPVTLVKHLAEREQGIRNEPEDQRRAKEKQVAGEAGKTVPALTGKLSRATQTSVKFIRWCCPCSGSRPPGRPRWRKPGPHSSLNN